MDRYDPYTDKFIRETIDRQDAIDALCKNGLEKERSGQLVMAMCEAKQWAIDTIEQLPSAQPYTIHSDGRLWITVDDIDKVTAVVVDEHKSKFCKQFYEDYEDAQLEIIYCKDCRKHNKRIGDYVEKSDGTYDWIWKDQACPLAEFRGVAQGHEFDYQFCAYGERRTE